MAILVVVFGDYVCTSVIVVGLLALLSLLLLPKLTDVRRGRKGSRRAVAAAIVAVMVILGMYLSAVYVDYRGWSDRRELELTVNVTAPQGWGGAVWVPVSANHDLQRAIRVVRGEGEVSLETTDRGRALRVGFQGSVSVRGALVTREDIGEWRLTMLKDDFWGSRLIYWSFLSLTGDGAPRVELRFEHHTYTEDDWYVSSFVPSDGWGIFDVSYDHVQRYY